jgi:hypothetical protein
MAIYPNLRGMGYACVEMPNKVLSFGIISPRPYNVGKLLKRVRKLLNFYAPSIIIIRDANKVDSLRMRKLINEITECAVDVKTPIYQYSRNQVKQVFERFGVSTKQEIADYIILEWLPELADHRPRARGLWEPEDYYMGVFDSLALIMTHEYLADNKDA